jgi:hypothetical protein
VLRDRLGTRAKLIASRCCRSAAAAGAALALLVAVITPSASAAALTDDDYLRFADRVAERLDRTWDADDGRYVMGNRGLDAIYDAALLTVHATAALHGHVGPARNDERARRLAERLTESPPFFAGPAAPVPDSMFHTPGWTGNMVGDYGAMDKAIDPKVAEALALTWRARDVLALAPETTARIREAITSVAHGAFFRFPSVRLNQINWGAELYAYAADVTGDAQLLRDDYGRQVRRFLAGVRRAWFAPSRDAATNLSPSMRFQYKPDQTPRSGTNLDSSEYANITLHFIAWHQAARAAGMPALGPDDRRLLRAWVRRVLFGYWTHSGMLNWDTGLGLRRWMKGKTWAYAQQGLLAIAASPAFQADPRQRAWAKTMFDRGLRLYERLDARGPRLDELPHPALMEVEPARQSASDARIFAARMAANAVRAVTMGLGKMPGEEPPAFYAFDPDVGRLAVSTPVYSTAIIPVNRGAFPYGGIELARLLDRDGAPLTGVGGTAPSAPGIQVHDASGRLVLASQVGLTRDPRRPPLALTRSPEGPVTRADPTPGSVHAGRFRTLTAVGRRRSGDFLLTTRHRFGDRAIEERWRVERRSGRRWYRASVVLPSSGSESTVEAIMRDGRVIALVPGAAGVALRSVSRFRVQSHDGAYTVVPLAAGRGSARAIAMSPQPTAPAPGPALELELAGGRHFDRRELRARILPERPALAEGAG